MYSLLLRKALPFALTFILGSLVGGLFKSIGFGGPSVGDARAFRYSHGGRHSCRMRFQPRNLVAESKPLQILDKPSPWWAWGDAGSPAPVRVLVKFGADGRVQNVEQLDHFELPREIAETAKKAAWRIQFEPETVNGVPVSVTKEVEINFMFE